MAVDGTELLVQVDHSGPHPVIRLTGDVDIESADELSETLKAELTAAGARPLVLDLTDVDFMDSSGLGVLVGAHKEAAALDGTLILANPHPRVAKILRITKLHKVFTISSSVDEAMATAGAG